jgi:hypothetical protein
MHFQGDLQQAPRMPRSPPGLWLQREGEDACSGTSSASTAPEATTNARSAASSDSLGTTGGCRGVPRGCVQGHHATDVANFVVDSNLHPLLLGGSLHPVPPQTTSTRARGEVPELSVVCPLCGKTPFATPVLALSWFPPSSQRLQEVASTAWQGRSSGR